MDLPLTNEMLSDLKKLEIAFEKRSWRPGVEPLIGSSDCEVLAERYGDRGRSCYVVFVCKHTDKTYGCRHERCFRDGDERGPSFRSLEEAIRHQRRYHFC